MNMKDSSKPQKSASLIRAMNKRIASPCICLKREDVAAKLKIYPHEVLNLAIEEKLTPYVHFTDKKMYGFHVNDMPWRLAGVVSVTGLFYPRLRALFDFLRRDNPDEVHHEVNFCPSIECPPEIDAVSSKSLSKFPLHSSLSGIYLQGIGGQINTREKDVQDMDMFEVAMPLDKRITRGHPMRIGDFVYLKTEVERVTEERTGQEKGRKVIDMRVEAIMGAVKKLGVDHLAPKRGDRTEVMETAIADSSPAIFLTESTAPKAYQECIRRGLIKAQ